MSNPTNPFSWQMPTATDLVTDLPADFEVFGQAVATSLADLLGGTTGQVLKKNTNADMDFVWSADSAGMTNPMTTTGDTIYSSSGSTPARLAIGSTGNVLTVAGGVPTWAAPAGGGKVLQVVQGSYSTQTAVASTSLTDTGLSLAITPTLNTSKVLVLVTQSYNVEVASNINISFEFDIKRDATSIFNQPINGGNYWNWDVAGLTWQHRNIFSAQYLDSPATTSSTTYKTQGRLNNTTNRILRFQGDSGVSTITLLEIGA
jgi:hypothetical protein